MPSRALAPLRSSATRRMVSSSENSIGACHAFRADAAIRLWSRIYTFGQGCRTSYQVSALRATAPVAAPLGDPAAPCQTAKGQLPTGTAEAGRPRATYSPHRLQDYRWPGLAVFGGYDGPRRRLTGSPALSTLYRTVMIPCPRVRVDHVLIARNPPESGIKKPLKTSMFSRAFLVAGAGFEPATFRL